jgi:hypothetical protein
MTVPIYAIKRCAQYIVAFFSIIEQKFFFGSTYFNRIANRTLRKLDIPTIYVGPLINPQRHGFSPYIKVTVTVADFPQSVQDELKDVDAVIDTGADFSALLTVTKVLGHALKQPDKFVDKETNLGDGVWGKTSIIIDNRVFFMDTFLMHSGKSKSTTVLIGQDIIRHGTLLQLPSSIFPPNGEFAFFLDL